MPSLITLFTVNALTAVCSLLFPPIGHGVIVLACTVIISKEKLPSKIYALCAFIIGQGAAIFQTVFYDGAVDLYMHGYFFMATMASWLLGSILGKYTWSHLGRNPT